MPSGLRTGAGGVPLSRLASNGTLFSRPVTLPLSLGQPESFVIDLRRARDTYLLETGEL